MTLFVTLYLSVFPRYLIVAHKGAEFIEQKTNQHLKPDNRWGYMYIVCGWDNLHNYHMFLGELYLTVTVNNGKFMTIYVDKGRNYCGKPTVLCNSYVRVSDLTIII